MAAFAAIATVPGRDENAPFPLLGMVGDYLTHDQLMPPCRLRWSRRLGRPLMEWFIQNLPYGDVVGSAYIEEIHPHETLLTGSMRRATIPQHVVQWSTLCRGLTRNDLWDVCIVDTEFEDEPYAEAWMRRYGVTWPFIARGRSHPALERLYNSHVRFCEAVSNHADACDMTITVE